MPDSTFDHRIEGLLAYGERPQDEAFTIGVMQGIRQQQRMRKLILWVFGLIGGLFGITGAIMLSGSLAHLVILAENLPAIETMQLTLVVAAAAAFYNWFMNDDWVLGN